eukprot:15366948-Ditylum_brightwellii.AAC.1
MKTNLVLPLMVRTLEPIPDENGWRSSRIRQTTVASSRTAQASLSSISYRALSRDEKLLVPRIGKGKTPTGLVGIPVDYNA